MPHLWEVKHPYYCNEGNYFAKGNEQPTESYERWADFMEAEGDSDFDMNLVFRWDWREADPEEEHWGNKTEVLLIFWMGQRKGLYRWTETTVTKDDEPAVREWLQARLDYLAMMWAPLAPRPMVAEHCATEAKPNP